MSQPPTFYQMCSSWSNPACYFQYTVSRQAIPFPLLPSNFCTIRDASETAAKTRDDVQDASAEGQCSFPPFFPEFTISCTSFPDGR